MCGICGLFNIKGKKSIEPSTEKEMTAKLRHRGPENTAYHFGNNISLGFTRLSIIDLDGGMQPIFNENNSIVMVCNGEIFNYIELRQELIKRGHRFKTRTDVEVIIHKRSYLDYKLRLVSHLISDHGDRMAYANSVEGRYPFLDKDLVEFVVTIPPDLKLKDFEEKYILKKLARHLIPEEIIKREKFAFQAPGSPFLFKRNIEYINHLISPGIIKHQGYFNPFTIERLRKQYSSEDFKLTVPYESDLLVTVITFGIFLEEFKFST